MTPLAAVAALALAAGAEEKPSPFAGCDVMGSVEDGWGYFCRAFRARIWDGQDRDRAFGYLAGSSTDLGDDADRREEEVTLAGRKAKLFTVEARNGRAGVEMALIDRPEGLRAVSCASAPLGVEPCGAALEWLASRPWRPGAAPDATLVKEPTATLAGARVESPEGCEAIGNRNGGGMVKCPSGAVAVWVPVGDEAEERRVLGDFARFFQRFTPEGGASQGEAVRCLVGGVETRCQPFREAGQVIGLVASARIRGRFLVAMCVGPAKRPLGPPCSVVFELPAESN